MSIRRGKNLLWTEAEDAALIQAREHGIVQIPNRTRKACCERACELRRSGVHVKKLPFKDEWTAEEDELALAGITPSGRSDVATTARAVILRRERCLPKKNVRGYTETEIAQIMRGNRQLPGRTWKGVTRQIEAMRASGMDVPAPKASWPRPGYMCRKTSAPVHDTVIMDPLAAAVWKATQSLPPHLAGPARSELTIVILEGRVDYTAITPIDVRNAIKAGGDQIKAGGYGHVSLYAPRSGNEGLTWFDTLSAAA